MKGRLMAVWLVTAGCSSVTIEAPLVTVRTELVAYNPGDSVLVRLSSLTDRELLFDGCAVNLQRYQADGWALVEGSAPLCAPALSTLPPGGTHVGKLQLPASIASGVYRIVFSSVYDEGNTPLAVELRTSNPFRLP